jgi:hypothetical protein
MNNLAFYLGKDRLVREVMDRRIVVVEPSLLPRKAIAIMQHERVTTPSTATTLLNEVRK